MIRVTALLLASATSASAQTCIDVLTIRDAGVGRAVVTYHNGYPGCSNGTIKPHVLVSPAGIAVEVSIAVGADEERIEVVPRDPNMMAFPPVSEVPDGNTIEIIIMGGLA